MSDNKQGIVKKQLLTDEEVREIRELLDICNAYEGLDLKISLSAGQMLSGNEANDLLYYEDGKLVGFLSIDRYGSDQREVVAMVHPDYRRKGIFHALLAAAKEECKQRGIPRLVLICERFSPSGLATVAAIGAQYDFSEHRMELAEEIRPRPAHDAIQLQQATTEDAEVLVHITAASFGDSEEQAQRHIASDLGTPHCEFYIAKLGQRPVGSFKLYDNDQGASIYTFGVLPEYRRRGYGRQMLEQIISSIRAEGQKRIFLEVDTQNTSAIVLYRSCGFKEVTTYGYYNLDIS